MSFQQGLSGLSAASKNLEVIGNNISNANTIGAKSSRAEFSDLYASAVGGGGSVGGRPRRGGIAGVVSAGVLAALRRSVETLSVLSPICRRKKWLDRSRTR